MNLTNDRATASAVKRSAKLAKWEAYKNAQNVEISDKDERMIIELATDSLPEMEVSDIYEIFEKREANRRKLVSATSRQTDSLKRTDADAW